MAKNKGEQPQSKTEKSRDEFARPNSVEAENAVLAGLMTDPLIVEDVIHNLSEDCFYLDKNRIIFKAVMRLYREGIGIDPITVDTCLSTTEGAEDYGGIAYLRKLLQSMVNPIFTEDHARTLVRLATMRRLVAASRSILNQTYDSNPNNLEALLTASQASMAAVFDSGKGKSIVNAEELSSEAVAALKQGDVRYMTGFNDGASNLDKIFRLRPGNYLVIGAFPGCGKTSLAIQLAWFFASSGISCMFSTLEMTKVDIYFRLLSHETDMSVDEIRADINAYDVCNGMKALSRLPLCFSDDEHSDIDDILALAEHRKRVYGLDVLIIDYLQLVSASEDVSPKATKHDKLSDINQRIKRFKNRTGITVIATSQLSKRQGKTNEKPSAENLYESGTIHQMADHILLIHRPKPKEGISIDDQIYKSVPGEYDIAELIIEKQRGGVAGVSIPIAFFGSLTKFGMIE